MGAYFRTTMHSLRAVPSEVWWHLYHIHFLLPSCRVPWVMERLWESLLTQRPYSVRLQPFEPPLQANVLA